MAASKSTKPRAYDRFWSFVQRAEDDACWLWTASRTKDGYGKLWLPSTQKMEGAHRVAWSLTYGPIPNGLWVLHRCDNPPCCRPDHLFLGTRTDNALDMVQKGRGNRLFLGYRGWNAKLSDLQIRNVRARFAAGEAKKAIARDLKVDPQTIRAIVTGKNYRLVP